MSTVSYEKIRAVNWSTLKHILESPKHYLHARDQGTTDKAAWRDGRGIHCLVLEPEKFEGRYARWKGKKKWVKKDVQPTKEFEQWLEDNAGKEEVGPADEARWRGAAAAVAAHPEASKLLRGTKEHTIEWVDAVTGIACKGRIDATDGFVVDQKGTKDLDPESWEWDLTKFLYHGQLAWYHDGAIAASVIPADARPPSFIVHEWGAPFDVCVRDLTPTGLEMGRTVYRWMLDKLKRCEDLNWWPGKCPDRLPVEPKRLPRIIADELTPTIEEFMAS